MKKYMLYGHGGAYNHGAEAIIRTTVPILRQRDSGAQVFLSGHFPEQDREFGLDKLVDRLIPADLSLVPVERAAEGFDAKERAAAEIYRDALSEIDGGTVCIGVGGDNYCYPNWHRQAVFHHTAKAKGARSVLWGCSVEPGMIDSRMAEILRGHDCIYARESLTAEALRAHGAGNVILRPDPAFQLTPEPVPLPEGFCAGSTAAINLSPLVLRRSDGLMEHFVKTARLLLERYEALLLLPHVVMPVDDDREALHELERRLAPEEQTRICRTPDSASAAQLKYLVSQCRMLVCCRTHASIAGYSSGVPTLVAGYSVKSQGIARDLGMDRWVVSIEKMYMLPELTAALYERTKSTK